MMIGNGIFKILAAAAAVACAFGCSGGGGGSNLPDPKVNFVNASPDAGPVTFRYDNDVKAAGIAYATGSGNITVDDGDHDITAEDGALNVLDVIAFTGAKDKQYVALTKGLVNYGSEVEKRFRLSSFEYSKFGPQGNKARLLIVHAFMREAGFQTPDIDFRTPLDPPTYPTVTNISFDDSAPATLEVNSGVATTFQARRAGTENAYASATATFDAGGIYIALVTGIENGAGALAPQIVYIKLN